MSVLGLRGSTISVVEVTGTTWNGRAVRVVDESKTSESLIGFLIAGSSPSALSVGSVVHFKNRQFVVRDSGDIRAVIVSELH